eukprot:s1217_g14.t3
MTTGVSDGAHNEQIAGNQIEFGNVLDANGKDCANTASVFMRVVDMVDAVLTVMSEDGSLGHRMLAPDSESSWRCRHFSSFFCLGLKQIGDGPGFTTLGGAFLRRGVHLIFPDPGSRILVPVGSGHGASAAALKNQWLPPPGRGFKDLVLVAGPVQLQGGKAPTNLVFFLEIGHHLQEQHCCCLNPPRSFAMPFVLRNVILLACLSVFHEGMCRATCVTLKDEAQTEDVSFLAHVRGWLPQGVSAPDKLEVKVVETAHKQARQMTVPCANRSNDLQTSNCIVAEVQEAFGILQHASDLSPQNPEIDKSLTKLVAMVLSPKSPEVVKSVLGNQEVQILLKSMWDDLSKAEFAMESWWTRRFLKEEVSLEGTNTFWYRDNYKELIALEIEHLETMGHRPGPGDHIVFVGGGPLPFSALDYFFQTRAKITVVESDPLAVQLSSALLGQLNLTGSINVQHAAGEVFDYKGATHLIVAALVRDEHLVIQHALDTAALSVIGARSADGLRSILYPPLHMATQDLSIKCTGSSSVNERVVNTLVTFEPMQVRQVGS